MAESEELGRGVGRERRGGRTGKVGWRGRGVKRIEGGWREKNDGEREGEEERRMVAGG